MADEALVVDRPAERLLSGRRAGRESGGDEIVPLVNDLIRQRRPRGADAGLAPRRSFELCFQPSGKQPFTMIDMPMASRRCGRTIASRAAWARISIPALPGPRPSLSSARAFGLHIDSYSAFFENDRFDADGPCRVPARTRHRHIDPGRAGDRFLRRASRRSTRSSKVSLPRCGSMHAAASISTARST
jgi:nicotinamidase/pyrazinamidase